MENSTDWKSEASNGSVVVCGEDGEFHYPEEWPQCSATIACGPPLPVPANDPRLNSSAPPATIAWLAATTGEDGYKTKVTYDSPVTFSYSAGGIPVHKWLQV